MEDKPDNPAIDLDYRLVFDALLWVLSKKPVQVDEDVIIDAVKGKKIKKDDLETIVNLLDQQT